MTNAHNQFTLLAHTINEFHWMLSGIVSFAELTGSSIQSATETIALQTGNNTELNLLFSLSISEYSPISDLQWSTVQTLKRIRDLFRL